MNSTSKIDPSTLGWVKTEIDETLKQARLALESYAENPQDNGQLRSCVTYLHQVVGTLQMVELDGAGMLARDAELLAEAVLSEKVTPGQPVFELLTRAIITLPDYLSRLQYGQRDTPLRLLPLVNELRAAYQATPISELDLFNPDLSVRPPKDGERRKGSEQEFNAAVKKIRPAFQSTLLKWLKDTGNHGHLNKMAEMLSELERQANVGVIEQLFWVSSGLLAALIAGDLEITNDRKKLLARIEQQIKKLVDGSEKAVVRNSSESLIKSLLFQLGGAKSRDEKVIQLKAAFELDALFGNAPNADVSVEDLPAPEVMDSVAQALGKEIETAQELLAAFFDTGREDVTTLAPLNTLLEKMGRTLDMLGVSPLKIMVDELVAVAQAIMTTQIEPSEAVSMQMAGALLLLENGAREMHISGSGWRRQVDDRTNALRALRGVPTEGAALDGIEISDAALTEAEFKQLLKVVAAEIRVNLAKVEESLEAFAAHADDVAHIEHTPQYLSQIQGALQILGQTRAAELTAITHGYIDDIQSKKLEADHAIFDALAVAVGTIEVYLEGLERDRPNIEQLIDAALKELNETIGNVAGRTPTSIVQQIAAWLATPHDSDAAAALAEQLRTIMSRAEAKGADKIVHIAGETLNLVEIVQREPEQLSDEIRDTLKTSADILTGLMSEVGLKLGAAEAEPSAVPKPAAPAATAPNAAMEDLDEEIMQIFIEDARDVYQSIDRSLATWEREPDNNDALAELRRGYHTLKGSGRMVGASEIAELAWSIEHLLNHVREGKVPRSPEIVTLLHDIKAVLPPMIAQLEGAAAPDADIDALRARAEALVQKKSTPAPDAVDDLTLEMPEPMADETLPELEIASEPTTSPVPTFEVSSNDGDAMEPMPVMDPTLLQIFTSEAGGHLNTIRDFVAEGAGNAVTHSLLRAAHTLQGNARSLELQPMARACSEMEKYLQHLELRQLPVDRASVELLRGVDVAVSELLQALNRGTGLTEKLRASFQHLAQAFSAGIEHLANDAPPAAPDTDTRFETVSEPAAPTATPTFEPKATTVDPAPVATEPVTEEAFEEIIEHIDPELLEIFQEEATDILESVEESLTQWRTSPSDRASLHSLKRALHTLKGGARMAGAMTMGNVGHHTESLLKHVEDGKVQSSQELFDLLDEVHDTLAEMLKGLESGAPVPARALTLNNKLLERLGEKPVAPKRPAAAAPVVSPSQVEPQRPTPTVTADTADDVAAAPPAELPADVKTNVMPFPAERSMPEVAAAAAEEDEDDAEPFAPRKEKKEHIKVRTALLNDLVNYAGEVSISRSRMEQQIFGLREHLAELNGNVTRFREQIRELEIQSESQILYRAADNAGATTHADFDPLEFDRFSRLQQVSRSLAESVHDLTTLQGTLDLFVGEAETVLQQQARVNTDLQEGLMRTRMINFSTQAARLRHIVRTTARELNKRAELQIIGTEVEVDRNVLERMIGPFEHMIRNSLDHGIEDEAERKRRKKPAVGKITIQTAHEGSEIVIRFSDDGAGLNVQAIRKKAVERGLAKANANLADDEIMQFILLPGFSTAEKITHVSGRGVGMDVVHNEVKQLGGSITVDTQSGVGTTFIVRLPLTLSITQALMVYVGDNVYAIPLSSVVNILEVPIEKLNQIAMGEKALFHHVDQVFPFMHLAARLGVPSLPRTTRKVPVLICKSGTRQIAIQIDGLSGTKEVVIKSLGPQLSEIKGLAGATILGDGSVVLILDVGGLWLTDEGLYVARTHQVAQEPVKEERRRPLVMVVDDSLTVRKVTSRHLTKRGMDVLVAKDGLDAWEQLREHVPDVMLVDIEMPRMDGYELTTNIRGDARLKHVPIIMITSRAGAKHRDRALQLGVNIYMSKPYQEDELMKNVDALIGAAVE